MGAAAATGEGAVKQAWWLMRGTGGFERKSSIIQKGRWKRRAWRGGRRQSGGCWLTDSCLEYTVCRGPEGGGWGARGWSTPTYGSEIINQQQPCFCCMWTQDVPGTHLAGVASACGPEAEHPGSRRTATKSAVLCSQVSSLCRTSLGNNSFTLAAAQYSHNQSCHQPAVQTPAEELYSYENHGESIQGHSTQCTTPSCIANALPFVSASTVLKMKVKKICCT